jgi:predicted transposase YbfD/YdcC
MEFSESFFVYFGEMSDPRVERTKRHSLVDILFLCVCAVLCGPHDCVAIADFGRGRQQWLKQFVALEGGPPSHDTISRVLGLLDPPSLSACFVAWVAAIQDMTGGQVIAIDGKTVRRSFDLATGKAAIHMVSAWGCANGIVLGQVKTEEKSNEITAIPELLKMLDLVGNVVTIDAMGTQKAIAEQIVKQGGEYVLAAKGNQPDLYGDIQACFQRAIDNRFMDGNADTINYDFHQSVDADHGRIETRRCWCLPVTDDLTTANQWRGIQSIALIEGERKIGDKTTLERRYFISSLEVDAKRIARAVRAHWGIENSLHWVLDVTFNEDQMRTRKNNGPQIRAILNHTALNICKNNTTRKASIRRKRNMAAWDQDYLTELITNQKN